MGRSFCKYSKKIKIIKFIKENNQNSPVVVHCSAGVGRTGTFISAFNLYYEIIEQIKNKNAKIIFSIFNMVRKLKEMRLYSVQNEIQYIFLYKFSKKLLNEYN